jgi:hypothetical protein
VENLRKLAQAGDGDLLQRSRSQSVWLRILGGLLQTLQAAHFAHLDGRRRSGAGDYKN